MLTKAEMDDLRRLWDHRGMSMGLRNRADEEMDKQLSALLDAADRVGVLEALLREASPGLHQRLNQHRCRATCLACRIDAALAAEPEAAQVDHYYQSLAERGQALGEVLGMATPEPPSFLDEEATP